MDYIKNRAFLVEENNGEMMKSIRQKNLKKILPQINRRKS